MMVTFISATFYIRFLGCFDGGYSAAEKVPSIVSGSAVVRLPTSRVGIGGDSVVCFLRVISFDQGSVPGLILLPFMFTLVRGG